MSDTNENTQPEAPESHEHMPAGQTSTSNRLLMGVLLLLLVLGGTLFYLWQQQSKTRADLTAIEGSIDKLLGVMERRHQEQLEQLKQVPQHPHPQLEQQLDNAARAQRQLQGQLSALRQQLGQESRDWLIAEVDYLLRVAEHRLVLERDPQSATAALRSAANRLMQLDDDLFAAVIQQINDDINAITNSPLPDRSAISHRLSELVAAVETLTLSTRVAPTAAESDAQRSEPPLDQSTWKAIWQKLWRDIRGLVTIRREDDVKRPTLAPEQRYFLRQNLQLKLESARLALLAGNTTAWRASINEAGSWLQRYFDLNDAAVNDTIATLHQLREVELNPPLPPLGNARRLLQEANRQSQREQPAAENANSPSAESAESDRTAAPAPPAATASPERDEQAAQPEETATEPSTGDTTKAGQGDSPPTQEAQQPPSDDQPQDENP